MCLCFLFFLMFFVGKF
uniref:Uncharacterized protein n=1 Tax=Rhizophora mucronata TaxID=61149 RepID=A0A2P2Q233_RHIMU